MSEKGQDIICYWGSGSAPSWRVIICLFEKQLTEASLECLSMSDKEHKEPRVLDINPRGQVPTFKDGNVIINESIAICQYLANTYKDQGTQLVPNDGILEALNLQRINEIHNLYDKVIDLSRYYWKRRPYYTEEVVSQKKTELLAEINVWESYISNGYLVGDSFSLADTCFFPVIAFMVRLGFNITQFENLNQFYELHLKRDTIINSWPPHWKESPNKTIFSQLLN